MPVPRWKPVRTLQECDAIMTGPGQFHEMEHAVIENRVYRVYKNLWHSIREFWRLTVSENTERHDADYLVFEETRIKYGQADEMVQRLASILHEVYGVRKGDRVGIAMRNYPEWIITFWAAGILGAVPTAFNAWLPIEPFMHCVKITTPKVIVLDSERLALLKTHLPSLQTSVILVRPTSLKEVPGHGVREWYKIMSSYAGSITTWKKEPEALPDDNATIFFTSGTTGMPKGVLSTQRGFLGNIFNAIAAARRSELRNGSDLPPPIGQGSAPTEAKKIGSLVAVPLFHVTGCTSQMAILTTQGGKLVLMRKWDKDVAAKLFQEEELTGTTGVPSIVYDLLETNIIGNPNVETLGTGGAPAADALPSEIMVKFPNVRPQQGYGLSETNSIAVQVIGNDYLQRPGSTGLPPPVVDLLVVDPNTGKVLPRNEIGELWIRGPNIMRGYYKNIKATKEAITRDGWLKSGDFASIDEEGFVYIKDRVKDMIIRGGENIHSIMVENALFADPRILDCGVIGLPDKRLGELVGAAVVLRQEYRDKVSEEDILEKVKLILPAFAVPSMIHVQNQVIERNAAGKILKKELRKKLVVIWEKRNKTAKGKAKAKL